VRCRELDIFKILGIFLEFFEMILWYEYFGRNFYGEIFWEDFLGGFFWEEFFVYIVKISLVI
jgi:hypothetical protein